MTTTIATSTTARAEDAAGQTLRALFLTAAIVLAVLLVARVYTGWRLGIALTPPSGIWTALAVDLKNGVFYRPPFGYLGYGGTRYFPLHFVLHAALMGIGLGPEAAGHLLEAIAGVALLLGVYQILRQLGIDRVMAACMSLLVLVPRVGQIALLSIRGDMLPTALNVLGLAICMRPVIALRHLLGAAVLFTLAFSAKPTSLFGVVAVVLSFALSGRLKQASQLLLATAAGCVGVLGVLLFATGGRFLDNMRACAVAAGYFPIAGIMHLVTWPAQELPVELVFLVLGFAGLFALPRRKVVEIPGLFFISTAVATAIVLGAVGTNINHFLDLHVAALVVFAAWLFDDATKEKRFGIALLVFAAFFAMSPIYWSLRHEDSVANFGAGYFDFGYSAGFHDALQFIGRQDRPILSDNPLLPIQAGQQPYLLDLWMFTMISGAHPAFGEPMSVAIREHQFGAIVLEDEVKSAARTSPYFWPLRQAREIEEYYQLAKCFPRACVYLPR